jgi:ABC-type transporter Mla MlaB component
MGMLRITEIGETPTRITLKVEGQLVSDLVAEFERQCDRWTPAKRLVYLDVADVTLIDGRGVKTLKQLLRRNFKIASSTALIEELLGNGEKEIAHE